MSGNKDKLIAFNYFGGKFTWLEYLYKYFPELNKYSKDCEFIGCTHIKEENCGIKEAVENGNIAQARYERFCKIYLDLKQKEARKW